MPLVALLCEILKCCLELLKRSWTAGTGPGKDLKTDQASIHADDFLFRNTKCRGAVLFVFLVSPLAILEFDSAVLFFVFLLDI